MKIAVYYGIKNVARRFDTYTTCEEILERSNKDQGRMIVHQLKTTGCCVLPIKGSLDRVYYEVVE
jgi:hypothetical protein